MKETTIALVAAAVIILAVGSYRYWEYSECRAVNHGVAYCIFHSGD